ncbi:MFS transporter [Streptomyces sp. P9-2B-2]|uniref:MFS transporter n=1 Tax=Streptomyces TaxID=1883 RepID=UPI002253872C|nr:MULTISPECIES: MFS transporter [Streptomyces]MCX4640648.1 MFS transporter [Streptomyces platensis]WJY38687.1 MFS transporter [Streptomyces sp. P9-2B-2]
METEHIPEPAAGDTAATRPGLGRGTLLLMSVAAGLSVAGNYFAQPLLDVIGRDLHLSASTAALVVTVAQVGYGLGLLLLVPLGDLLERRGLAVTLTALTAVFLTVTASAPNAALLLTGTALTGLASVAAQVVVPYAATLAAPAERGRTVGTVMTGLLLGILLARTAAGLLAELGGWRTVYWVNAALMLLMAVLLRLRLPALRTTAGLRYPALLRSTLALFRQEPVLRWRGALGALTFAGFSVLWTALAFLMSGPSYGWQESAIGLLGLVGAAGSLSASVAGRLADRGLAHRVTGAAAFLLLGSWGLLALGGAGGAWSLAALLAGVIILDLSAQAVHISNQNLVYAVRPESRNRLNSAYMTSYFVGGAIGSALTSAVWGAAGWHGVCVLGATLAAVVVALWALERMRRRAAGGGRKGAVAESEAVTPSVRC